MRYTSALGLALLMGAVQLIPAAFAAEKDTPQMADSTIAVQSYGSSGDSGTVAGPMAPSFHVPVVEHDPGGRN
jgi:hypothetical protein